MCGALERGSHRFHANAWTTGNVVDGVHVYAIAATDHSLCDISLPNRESSGASDAFACDLPVSYSEQQLPWNFVRN